MKRFILLSLVSFMITCVLIILVFPSKVSLQFEVNDLSDEEATEIKQILEKEFLGLWPLENYKVVLNDLYRNKNPLPNYSDVLYGRIEMHSPWVHRYDPVAGEAWSMILAKNKQTDKWELVEKICCCAACEEWY